MGAEEKKEEIIMKRWEEACGLISTCIRNLRKRVEGELNDDELFAEEFMNTYISIFRLCSQDLPPHDNDRRLYEMYRKSFGEYIVSIVLPALRKQHGELTVREFEKRWENYKVLVRRMSTMFSPLDLYLVKGKTGVVLPTLREVAFLCFRELVMGIDVKNGVLDLIRRERQGEMIEGALVKHVVDIFLEIGMECYKNDLEKPLFEDTATYYARKAALWIVEETCPQYMVKVEKCLTNEKHKVASYLHSSSEQNLVETIQYELLSRHEIQLLEKQDSGCAVLLRDDKKDDLSRMYRLFSKIPMGLEPVASILKQHVTSQGIALSKWAEDIADKHEFHHKVIEMHDKYMHGYAKQEFQNHRGILMACREAFSVICNQSVGGNPSAEVLAEFCDSVVRKASRGKVHMDDDDHIESIFEKIGELVDYVSDKDLFTEFCSKKLAKRLLFDKGINIHHEKNMLSRLKSQCGTLTLNMQIMINDFDISKKMEASFTNDLPISLGVKVLNRASWPSYKHSKLNIPSEMARCVQVFNEFYHGIHKHRKLTWIYSLGTCDIISRFDSKTIEITVPTSLAAMLSLFNDAGSMSYQEIVSQLQVNSEDEDVTRLLHSVSCGKYNILLKNPVNKSISSTDHFEFNPSFTHKSPKIKITLPQVKVEVEVDDKKKVIQSVNEERCHTIDCVIVRIMKVRKVLHHQQLMRDCVQELQKIFTPEIKAIQKRIDDLITREYLEADIDDSSLLKYVA